MACAALFVGLCAANGVAAQNLNFELIAGGAENEGGQALEASLPSGGDLAYDTQGNLFVALYNNNRIRMIAPSGTITTIVGGNTGFGGDGGPASSARIDRPGGIAFDASGNLYFSDSGNRRIRRISTSGTISTYAGNGGRTSSGDGGQAANASFASVERIAFDGNGNLYVAEASGNRVRKITPSGVISTIAGTGVAGFTGDNGAATSATLNFPMGVDVAADGTVYIADTNNNMVRRVSTDGTIVSWADVAYGYPNEVTIGPDGLLYVGDTGACVVVKFGTVLATSVVVAGKRIEGCGPTSDGVSAVAQRIGMPDGIAFDASGNLVFADIDMGQVRRVQGGSQIVTTLAGTTGQYVDGRGAIGAPLGYLLGIAADDAGNVLLADYGYRRIHRVASTGTIAAPVGTGWWGGSHDCPTSAPCNGKDFSVLVPWGIAPGDAPGEFLYSDRAMDRIFRLSATGSVTNWAGGFSGAYGDEGAASAVKIDAYGLAKDAGGTVYVANSRAQRVQRIKDGLVTNVAGSGSIPGSTGDGGAALAATLNAPQATAIDNAGNVLVSESSGLRVRKFTPGGSITTFAGNGTAGASGDGGAATSAAVGRVEGIAVHGSDTYISSEGQLRVIGADGIIRAVPGWTHRATALFVRGDVLYIATAEGHAYRAQLPAPRVRAVEHDYNGDGRSDILWRNTANGANAIWKSANGATQQAITGVNLAWKVVGQGDFDRDGNDDIVWRNVQNGANTIWRSGNAATPIKTTGVTDLGWAIVGVGDFNKDGKADLVWRHKTSGKNTIWTSPGGANIAVTALADQKWQIVGVGDFNGDGASDLFWRNATTGANQVWRGGNSAAQSAVANAAPAWKLQGVGDFDGDGRSDLFWRNATTGQDVVWNAASAGSARTLSTVTDLKWKVVAAGDYDGDGKDDLLWRHVTSGANTIWRSANGATLRAVTGVTNMAWMTAPYTNQP